MRSQKGIGSISNIANAPKANLCSTTRAWTLVRFFEAGCCTDAVLPLHRQFVAHKHDLQKGVVCGACQLPARGQIEEGGACGGRGDRRGDRRRNERGRRERGGSRGGLISLDRA
jgi:hypothetical protein